MRYTHWMEKEFGLPARQILDVINGRNRCKIAVRGAIAEAYLIRLLQAMKIEGKITDFEDFDIDGHPDCRVDYRGHAFLVECKNVQKGKTGPVTIDFWRTRSPKEKPWERYYQLQEFQVVAACLWNRTGTWDFRFAATADLPRHPEYADRLLNRLEVDLDESERWTADLASLLTRLAANLPPATRVPAEGTGI